MVGAWLLKAKGHLRLQEVSRELGGGEVCRKVVFGEGRLEGCLC